MIDAWEFIYYELIDQVIKIILLKKLNASSSSYLLPILDRDGGERYFSSRDWFDSWTNQCFTQALSAEESVVEMSMDMSKLRIKGNKTKCY